MCKNIVDESTINAECLDCVRKELFHFPLVTFLSKDPDDSMFENEMRSFPKVPSFSSLKIAMERTDMKKRTIDCVKSTPHSLLRCLSKEIFGTEKHTDILIAEVIAEFLENKKEYTGCIGEDIKKACKASIGEETYAYFSNTNDKRNKILAQSIKERIEDDLPCDELLLWLASTFLQTPIYVPRIIESRSFWMQYPKVRIKKRDRSKTTSYAIKCHDSSQYYVTLLETPDNQYHRIVPKLKVCNCLLEPPKSPNSEKESSRYNTQQGRSLTSATLFILTCIYAIHKINLIFL